MTASVTVTAAAPTPTPSPTPTPTPLDPPTNLTLSVNNSTPTVNQKVTFTATLSSDGTPLSGQNVTIYHYLNGARYNDTTTATNQSGQIAFITSFNSSGQRTYYAAFAGDSSYQTSTSSVVTVTAVDPTPTPRATQLSLSADNSTPAANQSFTVSGTLTTNGTAVPNEQITLQSASNGSVTLGTPTTTANGSYSLTVSIPTQGNYTLQASFNGDSSYASSNASLLMTVGSPQSAGTSRFTPNKWVGVDIQRS